MVSNRRRKIANKRGPSDARRSDAPDPAPPAKETWPTEPPPLQPLSDTERANRVAALARARGEQS